MEAISVILISKVAEALDIPPQVLGGAEIVGESVEVPDMARAPTGERSPSWAIEASWPITKVSASGAVNEDEL